MSVTVLLLLVLTLAAGETYAPGQIVEFNYHGQWIEGQVVRQDGSGILVRKKTDDGVYDPARSFQAYYAPKDVRAKGTAPAAPAAPAPPAAAPAPGPPQGSIVSAKYHGTWVEAQLVRRDASGVLVRFRTPEGTYDPSRSAQMYLPENDVRPAGAAPAAEPPVAAPAPRPAPAAAAPAGPVAPGPARAAAPVAAAGPPMTRAEVLTFLRARLGAAGIHHPDKEKVQDQLAALIRARGADFRLGALDDFNRELTQAGANLTTVPNAIRANFGPLATQDWLIGRWGVTKIAPTTRFERDGTVWERQEWGTKNGLLEIRADGTWSWDSASGHLSGRWRPATPEEMAVQYQGGAGIVLLQAKGGWDWIVSRSTNPDFQGDSIDIQEYASRGNMREYGGRLAN